MSTPVRTFFGIATLFLTLFFVSPSPTSAALGFTQLGSVNPDSASSVGLPTYLGDINNDSYDDLVVANNQVTTQTGKIYIYYGGTTLDTTVDVTITGETTSEFFPSNNGALGVRDINNDGYDDILAGAPGNDDAGSGAGKGYIYFGAANLSSSLAADTGATVTFSGDLTNKKGLGNTSTFGDFNGDGNLDFALASINANSNAGAVHIYFGNSTTSPDTTSDATLTVSGSTGLGAEGIHAVDINGDGYDDLVTEETTTQGEVYIFFGGTSMDGTHDVKFNGETTSDWLARNAISSGDINEDGVSDLCLGAARNDTAATNAGRVYCYFGSSSISGTKAVATTADLIFNGAAANDNLGRSVRLDDINNDGNIDLVAGAYQTDGSDDGYVNIYLGNGTTIDTTADATITTGVADLTFGNFVFSGDMDNDGYKDLVIAAPASTGLVYVYEITHGSPTLSMTSLTSTSDTTPTLTGTASVTGKNIANVQWSSTNTAGGTWTDCTADDGAFDETSEAVSCILTTQTDGSKTIYFRTIDDDSVYMTASAYASLTFTIDSSTPSVSSVATTSTVNTSGGENTTAPAPAVESGGGGTVTGSASTVIIEEGAIPFAVDISYTSISSYNPPFGVRSATCSIGDIHQIWLTDYYNKARILPSVQVKPSIIALNYNPFQLLIAGGGSIPERSLRLAFSSNGTTWTILPTSVVDTVNNTVAALHKIGGYYMITSCGGGSYSPRSYKKRATRGGDFDIPLAPAVENKPRTETSPPESNISDEVEKNNLQMFFDFIEGTLRDLHRDLF